MDSSSLDDRLRQDCHVLGHLSTSLLLLNRNAALPWFIVVPETLQGDVLDLPPEQRAAVLESCALVSRFIKQELGFEKVNFAGLGNVVPQMHLHIIGRNVADPCWPDPVWGNLAPGPVYEPQQVLQWQEMLQHSAALHPIAPEETV